MSLRRFFTAVLLVAMAIPAFADKVVIGSLGQALKESKIYASQTTASRVYYTVKQYHYLVVRPGRSTRWMPVLMSNGYIGYVLKDAVVALPYKVTAEISKEQLQANAKAGNAVVSSRGGTYVADYAQQFKGTPYVWGGNDLRNGIDCSGFVKKIFGTIGVSLPRTAAEQANVGKPITRLEDLQPGDRLYFWENKRQKIGHTGIYLGNGYFVHSSRGHNGVATDYLSAKWRKILIAARR